MVDRLDTLGGVVMSMNSKRPNADDRLSLDIIHDLLTARRRRYTLYYLYLHANPIRLPDVAEQSPSGSTAC